MALGIATILWSGTTLLADFSYQTTSKITGGMMASAMKMAGVVSKQAREPIQSTVMVKGNRMATVSAHAAHIIDLKNETMTEVNFDKKTYSVVTFAQLADMMKRMDEQMKSEKGKPVQNLTIKASVDKTGKTREIAGSDTREALVRIEMIGTDEKTGEPVTAMVVTSDMWLAKPASGYDEVRDFHRRMAEKLTWSPGMGMMAQPGMGKGMAEMAKEMSKLDGMPIYQFMVMGGPGSDQVAATHDPTAQPTPEPEQKGGLMGRLAAAKLGGFGHKKDDQDQQQGSGQQGQPGAGTMMEMVTEMSGFSTDSIDASKFEVPAGFQQVDYREPGTHHK
jgi:carbon monoxide dehydrogenase subunit G